MECIRSFCQCLGFPRELIIKIFNRQYPKIRDAVVQGDLLKVIQFHQSNYPTSSTQDQNLLHVAIKNNQPQIIQYILSNMNNIMIQDKTIDGDTPLILAILGNDLQLVKVLIDKGTNINVRENQGTTPFIVAAANGHLPILQYLALKGANSKLRNFKGQTALHRCCYYGHIHILKYIVKNQHKLSLKLSKKDRSGNNCLHTAAEGLSVALLQYLLKVSQDQELFLQENQGGETVYDVLERQFNMIRGQDIKTIEKKEIIRKLKGQRFDLEVGNRECVSRIITEEVKSLRDRNGEE